MKNERIKKEDLLQEIECALVDCFVAALTREEGSLVMQFENGQKFRLTLQEEK